MRIKNVSKFLATVLMFFQIVANTSFAKNMNTDSGMKIIVDRVEERIVVCENSYGEILNIKLSKFIPKPKSGKVYKKSKFGKYVLDKAETEKKESSISKKFYKLFR